MVDILQRQQGQPTGFHFLMDDSKSSIKPKFFIPFPKKEKDYLVLAVYSNASFNVTNSLILLKSRKKCSFILYVTQKLNFS